MSPIIVSVLSIVDDLGKDVSAASVSSLREGVQEAYSRAAEHPMQDHPFPVGRNFAESVSYPADLLRRLPAVSVQVFAGVSNLSILAEIPQGTTVLDLGCGGGLDSIIAARRTGPQGQVFAVDFSPAMLKCAKQGLLEAGSRMCGSTQPTPKGCR